MPGKINCNCLEEIMTLIEQVGEADLVSYDHDILSGRPYTNLTYNLRGKKGCKAIMHSYCFICGQKYGDK